MSTINHHAREISVKIVYYGPGLGGKTSSLQAIHRALTPETRGQLVSLATGNDRTLYFDFLPVRARVKGFTVRLQLYTVPGQVHYNSTRKLVLTGADGVVFVADSQRNRLTANEESLSNLEENLAEQGLTLHKMPLIVQYNKRDAPDVVPIEELEARLNRYGVARFETVAIRGQGVFEALKAISRGVLDELDRTRAVGLEQISQPKSPSPAERSGRASSATLTSLDQVADALERHAAVAADRASGLHRLPASVRSLEDLVASDRQRQQLSEVAGEIARGDWAGAVSRAGVAYHALAAALAAGASPNPPEAAARLALWAGVPASWYDRFTEAERRVGAGGAVTSADAIFALFFVTAVALRADELSASTS